jgi:hypothetical protein
MTPDSTVSRYLLMDDLTSRSELFEEHVSTDGLEIEVFDEAIDLEDEKDSLAGYTGAIVDFHLSTPTRPGYRCLRYPCTAEDCPGLSTDAYLCEEDADRAREEHAWHAAEVPAVDVTTGLGAMLYIKQHAPDITLYGFCELSAHHSLLFLLAAQTWLGASAINAASPPEEIRFALSSPDPEDALPINKQLTRAAVGFTSLTDSLNFLTRPGEAVDWLGAYRQCGYRGTLAEFKSLLNKHFDVKTLESDIYINIMCQWQAGLYRIMEAFDMDTNGWPDLRQVKSAKHWDKKNPVLDFLKDNDYRTFFTSPDMRAALAYHRANQRRIAEQDVLGGF